MQYESEGTSIEVIAYSGYKANERPLYFVLGNQKLEVTEILDRWYGREHDYFKVRARNGCLYLLRWHRFLDVWSLLREVRGVRGH